MNSEFDPGDRRSWKNLPPPDPELTDAIVAWYREHGRGFSWRPVRDPWLILCVELMLQRTRASQVEPVFDEFAARYSEPAEVVAAGLDATEEIFKQLGLRWRAEYFFDLQRQLAEKFDSQVPQEEDVLLSLPGVGRYAASAVRVFAFGMCETVVDSNVLRVVGRYFGIDFPDHARRSPRVGDWLSAMAPREPEVAREFNWGLIDFATSVCRPADPACSECLLQKRCWFGSR